MATQRLTNKGVAKMKPDPNRDTLVWDTCPGLGVRITPKGVKSFVFQYRVKGLPARRMTIGAYGAFTVDAARTEAQALRQQVARGVDPAAARAAARETASRSAQETVAGLAEAFFADLETYKKPRTVHGYRQVWNASIVPTLGDRPVREITPDELTALHRSMRKTPVAANRALNLMGTFYSYLIRQRVITAREKPTRELPRYNEGDGPGRELTTEEQGRLLAALDTAERVGLPPAPDRQREPTRPETAKHRREEYPTQPADPNAVAAIRLLYLTGWRPSEVYALRWSSLDLTGRVLTLVDSKTGPQKRPIGAGAVTLLESLPRSGPYVFRGSKSGTHLRSVRRLWAAVRHAAGVSGVRLYDLRHTYTTAGVDALGVAVMQKVIGHKSIQTTLRYTHLRERTVQDAADLVSGDFAARLAGAETPVTPIRRAAT
jgi:integrase